MSELKSVLWLGYVVPPLRAVTIGSRHLVRNVARQLRHARRDLAARMEDGPLASPPRGLTIDLDAAELSRRTRIDDEFALRRHVRPFSHPAASEDADHAWRG